MAKRSVVAAVACVVLTSLVAREAAVRLLQRRPGLEGLSVATEHGPARVQRVLVDGAPGVVRVVYVASEAGGEVSVRAGGERRRDARPADGGAGLLDVVLAVDASDSMAAPPGKFDAVAAAAADFVDALPSGQVSLLVFGSVVRQPCDFTADRGRIRRTLLEVVPTGRTALHDCVERAGSILAHRSGPRALVLVTDGYNSQDGRSLSEAVAICRTASVPVYAVGLGHEVEPAVLAGLARAMELSLLAERLPAQKALDWGLINRVVPDDQLAAEARKLAESLAAGPTLALGLMRQAYWKSFDNSYEQQLHLESTSQQVASASEDAAEGILAFQEKRPRNFKGR